MVAVISNLKRVQDGSTDDIGQPHHNVLDEELQSTIYRHSTSNLSGQKGWQYAHRVLFQFPTKGGLPATLTAAVDVEVCRDSFCLSRSTVPEQFTNAEHGGFTAIWLRLVGVGCRVNLGGFT